LDLCVAHAHLDGSIYAMYDAVSTPHLEGRTIMIHETGLGLCRGGFWYDGADKQITEYIASLRAAVDRQGAWADIIFGIFPKILVGSLIVGTIAWFFAGFLCGVAGAVVVLAEWYVIAAAGNSTNNTQFRAARRALQVAEDTGRIRLSRH
jgi:hypothetical protein